MNAIMNTPGERTMSSREIAELCGKRHDHVLRDIRTMLAQLYGDDATEEGLPERDKYEAFFDRMGWGIDSPKLGDQRIGGVKVARDGRGYISEIGLDYSHTMTLISGYKVKLRKAIVDKWQELEAQERVDPMAVLNDPAQMRGLLLSYSEKVLALEQVNAELTPKAEALDRIATADGSLNITASAKALQVRPKDLFAYLQAHGWIYRRAGGSGYLGYQSKVTTGLLEHKVTTILRADGSEKIVEQVLITAKGLAKLAALFPPSMRAA